MPNLKIFLLNSCVEKGFFSFQAYDLVWKQKFLSPGTPFFKMFVVQTSRNNKMNRLVASYDSGKF